MTHAKLVFDGINDDSPANRYIPDQKLDTLRHDLPGLFCEMLLDALMNEDKKDVPADKKIPFKIVEQMFLHENYWGNTIGIIEEKDRSRLYLRKDAPKHPVITKIIDILNSDPATSNIEAFNILSDTRSRLYIKLTDRRSLVTRISDLAHNVNEKLKRTIPPKS